MLSYEMAHLQTIESEKKKLRAQVREILSYEMVHLQTIESEKKKLRAN